MRHLLKKIVVLGFLLAGFMPVLFTLLLLCKQQLIKHEMKEMLEEEMLHTIIVPVAEVQWIKYKKEIRFQGKMFDIESITVKNAQYIFTGLYDEEETALNNYLKKNAEQKNESGYQVLSTLFQLLQSMYSENPDETLAFKNISKSYRPLILQNISPPFMNILTPPPQV